MSIIQMKYIFKTVLPRMITDFTNTTLIDVGSRLGAVLYGVSNCFDCKAWVVKSIRELKHVGRQHDDDGNQYNESMKRKK